MKFLKNLAAFVAALAVTSVAMAQFNTDQGTSGSDTKVSIKQTAPGAAELTFTGVKLVYLNRDPKIAGVKGQPDTSKKGTVYIVDTKLAPPDTEARLTSVGRGGWAGLGNGKVDDSKVKSAPLAETFTLPITIKNWGSGGAVGFTLLATTKAVDGVATMIPDVWVSLPAGSPLLKRGNGATDMVMVLYVDATGNISLASPDQIKAYAPVYTEVTTAVVAKK